MSANKKLLLTAFACVLMAGCSTARIVSTQPGKGGVIAVNPPQDADARTKATTIMTQNCGGAGFDIVEEGEAVVGSTSRSNVQKTTGLFGQPQLSGNTDTNNKTEWRISYRCKGVPVATDKMYF